uniref:Uncharacterized protein n=1 Tax=Angiostrongylus cantonensis TaxID=6313 RepID=A0A0K0D8L2_ANGCA
MAPISWRLIIRSRQCSGSDAVLHVQVLFRHRLWLTKSSIPLWFRSSYHICLGIETSYPNASRGIVSTSIRAKVASETTQRSQNHRVYLDIFKIEFQTIVQLSQRKMQRQKEKMLLDGFVTTQEVLSQRNPDTTAKHGILSVTTV